MSSPNSPAVTLQDLPGLRSKTERVSEALRQQLATHLDTLRPMYAPERIFGKFAGGKVDVHTAERALADVKEKFSAFSGSPFNLPSALVPAKFPIAVLLPSGGLHAYVVIFLYSRHLRSCH